MYFHPSTFANTYRDQRHDDGTSDKRLAAERPFVLRVPEILGEKAQAIATVETILDVIATLAEWRVANGFWEAVGPTEPWLAILLTGGVGNYVRGCQSIEKETARNIRDYLADPERACVRLMTFRTSLNACVLDSITSYDLAAKFERGEATIAEIAMADPSFIFWGTTLLLGQLVPFASEEPVDGEVTS